MFKSKKIVALVLCAMMLFVPVAAAAEESLNVDFLAKYADNVLEAANKAAVIGAKIGDGEGSVKDAAGKATAELEQNATTKTIKTRSEALDKAVKDYQEALKEAKDAVAKAESSKAAVEQFGLKKFYGDALKPFKLEGEKALTLEENGKRDKTNAENALKAIDKKLAEVKETIAEQEAAYVSVNETVKLAKAILPILEKGIVAGNDKKAAMDTITALTQFYNNDKHEEYKALVAPQILKAWKVFVANASEYEKASYLATMDKDVKELVLKAETKYEVASTGEKGWILSDEAKNGCLQNVADFKVEKKDGKFVAKVYDKDGKEMKIGQQLTVYRPIGKDVKVLKAKVDGKDVTFSVGLRNGQNYVSVPVIY